MKSFTKNIVLKMANHFLCIKLLIFLREKRISCFLTEMK